MIFPEIKGTRTWLFLVGILPFLIMNLFLYFSYQAEEEVSTIIFYTYPLIVALLLAGTIGETIASAFSFEAPSLKHIIYSIILGGVFGFILYQFLQPAFAIIFATLGVETKLMVSPHIVWLASYFQRLAIKVTPFMIIFLALVGIGEELLCLISMKALANAFYESGFGEANSLLGGIIISRGLWALSHWYSWGSLGLATLPNYVFAMYAGIAIFTWLGFIFRFRELWGPDTYKRYLSYGPIVAHFIYDFLAVSGLGFA